MMNLGARVTVALLAAAGLAGLAAAVPAAAAAGSPGTITTVAGGPGRGPATKVFQRPQTLAAGPGGVLYVGDNTVVRAFSDTRSWESVFAGNGGTGYSGNGTRASAAQLSVAALAVDGSGNVVIADFNNDRVRVAATTTGTFYGQAMTAGDIYTVAGNGEVGFSGDGGPATSAALYLPQGVAVGPAGNLVIADTGNNRVRVVAVTTGTFYGQAMTAGDIYTVAGDGTAGYAGDGGPATAAELGPGQVTVGPAGNILIATGDKVRVVAARTGTFYGVAMTAGDIYTVAGDGTAGYAGDGGPAISAELDLAASLAVDPAGNLVIADSFNARVRVVADKTGTFYGQAMTAGHIYTVAGDDAPGFAHGGGLATATTLSMPQAVTFDPAGNLVIGDGGAFFRVWVVAAKTGTFYGQAMTAGHIYVVAGNGKPGFSGNGGKAVNAELFSCCFRHAQSNVAVDGGNYVVVSSQQVWFIANSAGTYFGQAMTAGDIYVVAGTGKVGFAGDGGPATSAWFGPSSGLAVDSAGNLVIADTANDRIRVVAATTGTFYGQSMTADHVYTVAGDGTFGDSGDGGPATSAALNSPQEVTLDSAGNLIIADTNNNRVRVVAEKTRTFYGQAMTAGDIYTVAGNGKFGDSGDGGPATAAKLNLPGSVAVDRAGNLVIDDSCNSRTRLVAAKTGTFYGQAMTAGDIYTVAEPDSGPVAVDRAGNLVIAEGSRVRVLAAKTGTFYGVPMTAGGIYTVAGNGQQGFGGDGGPATSAELQDAQGVAVDQAGNLVIVDGGPYTRVRVVSG